MQGAKVRLPAVAGSFYPANPHALRADLETLLAEAAASGPARHKALIAPHAGYVYSGKVAAAAFAPLRACAGEVTRVVLIGPAHYVAFRGVSVPTAHSFATPIGPVPVDRDALAGISRLPFICVNDAAHAPEHALEVELPFLQVTLGSFALVPLLVGDARPQEVGQILGSLWGGQETLIVISSDLSHYQDYATAKRLDAATADRVERCEWDQLDARNACGFLPIAGALIEAERHGLKAERLALCNSGDTGGGRNRVVGYGAWSFRALGAGINESSNES
jgi:AmmeMemoRadiSam system protein B